MSVQPTAGPTRAAPSQQQGATAGAEKPPLAPGIFGLLQALFTGRLDEFLAQGKNEQPGRQFAEQQQHGMQGPHERSVAGLRPPNAG